MVAALARRGVGLIWDLLVRVHLQGVHGGLISGWVDNLRGRLEDSSRPVRKLLGRGRSGKKKEKSGKTSEEQHQEVSVDANTG